jgi:hypothetical protein
MPRGIEQIVNERVLRWQAEKRVQSPPPSGTRQRITKQRPMIAISRQCGSLGGELGRLVSRKLGFSFYSQELVHEVATAAHVRRESVLSLDEQPKSALEVMVREILDGEAFAASDYLHYLRGVLKALGERGEGVIIGRGAHILLDPTLTLRVRTHASFARRAENLAARLGVPREAAEQQVRRIDRERGEFYRQRFGVDWEDPGLVDLMVNTTSTPLDACAEIVAGAYRARFGPGG